MASMTKAQIRQALPRASEELVDGLKRSQAKGAVGKWMVVRWEQEERLYLGNIRAQKERLRTWMRYWRGKVKGVKGLPALEWTCSTQILEGARVVAVRVRGGRGK